jgi:hypothetical protein
MFGLAASGLLFVAALSVTGYWGMISLEKTTIEVCGV